MRTAVRAFVFGVAVVGALTVVPAARADQPIVTGGGSTWSQVAVDQWRADVQRFGLRINYQGVGSSAGRSLYIQNQVDFAVSEIPFEASEVSQLDGEHKGYVYLPIVAGGTSFMYNLSDASGNPITTLRLDATTAAKIFTGGITSWTDPAIRALNPGLALPDEKIIPVVRSDGSGTSAQFTTYMWKMVPDVWCPFAKANGIDPCRYTSSYPNFNGSVAQSGSDGVANYVHSDATGHGAITYVETAYALQRGRPVAFLENASGNFTLPTSKDVSTALTKATLNADHTQNLDQVYVNPDPNTYAMSSYSYMIAPTNNFDTAKGNELGQFMIYFACEGQRKADLLGYSPLPPNLVQVVFDAEQQVPGAPAPPPLSQCDNPTITGDNGGGTSNGTAGALSGGASSSGTAPHTGAIGHGGVSGGAGGAAAVGRSAAGGAAGGTGVNELGGGASGPAAAGGGTYASAAYASQVLPQIKLSRALPSVLPLLLSALVVALAVFGPPVGAMVVASRASRRRRS
jgi:phosphate ABC transporter phosphate-binding protein